MKRVCCDFPLSLNTGRGYSRLYLQHLGEERDHTNHDEEQADAINLPPLNHRVGYREGLQTHSHAAHILYSVLGPFVYIYGRVRKASVILLSVFTFVLFRKTCLNPA